MTTHAHTPGPWKVRQATGNLDLCISGKKNAVCVVPTHYGPFELRQANAHLIAQAWAIPQLVEALKVLVDHASERYPHFESERGQKDIAASQAALRLVEEETP